MSASQSLHVNNVLGLRNSEIKIALAAWGAYLIGTCIYCLVYQAIVRSVTPDLLRTVTLALREWGIWLVLTPFMFNRMQGSENESVASALRRQMPFAAFTLFIAIFVEIAIDQMTDTREAAATIAIFLPRYMAVLVVSYLVWHVFLRSSQAHSAHSSEQARTQSAAATLLVSKGADECLLSIEDIQYLSAARNYIEIRARNQCYLLRRTMKQLEEILPADRFVRVHRSHIVNLKEIERIKTHRSGSGTVHLRCGATLCLSKRYRAQLQQHSRHVH